MDAPCEIARLEWARRRGQPGLEIMLVKVVLESVANHQGSGARIDINAEEQIKIIGPCRGRAPEQGAIGHPESVFADRAGQLVTQKHREERLRKFAVELTEQEAETFDLPIGHTAGAIGQVSELPRNRAEPGVQLGQSQPAMKALRRGRQQGAEAGGTLHTVEVEGNAAFT